MCQVGQNKQLDIFSVWALIWKTYGYSTIIFGLPRDWSKTQMVAFHHKSFDCQLNS